MNNKKEVERLVKTAIKHLKQEQEREYFDTASSIGPHGSITRNWEKVSYPDMDVEDQKKRLSSDFDETVRCVIIREIRELMRVLTYASKNGEKLNISGIEKKGIGRFCKFTEADIKSLKLDDKEYVKNNYDQIIQNLYEAYGYDDQLPLAELRELNNKAIETTKSKNPNWQLEQLKYLRESAKISWQSGLRRNFGANGLPIKSDNEFENMMEVYNRRIAKIEMEESLRQQFSHENLPSAGKKSMKQWIKDLKQGNIRE